MDFFNKLADTCITALVKRVRGTPPAYFVDDSYDFFVLPLELRFKVYDFVMREEDGTQVRVECVHARWAPREWATSVQLLRTCQTIHIEGLQALYGSRSFVAGQAMVFVSFFNDITPRGFQHIKHLIIKQSMPPESIMDGEVAALDVSDGLLKSAWPKLESLRRVTLIYASDWRLSLSRELDLHVAFVRKIARSKPRSGHLLYDYMQLAPQPNVAWEIKLQVRQFDRTPLWTLIVEVKIHVIVDIIEIDFDGKAVRGWRLRGSDGGPVVPLIRHHNSFGVQDPEWQPLPGMIFP